MPKYDWKNDDHVDRLLSHAKDKDQMAKIINKHHQKKHQKFKKKLINTYHEL